jgi:AcrR family transcriptional regulator
MGLSRHQRRQIERAAGLAPRSGALYLHFKGKEDVLEKAIERELEAVDDLGSALDMLPLRDLRAELTLMARWNLASLDRRAQLARFVYREGDRLPAPLRRKLYGRLVERPYSQVVAWLRGRLQNAGAREPDLHALALIMIEPMSSYRSLQQLFGRVPGEVDDERFVKHLGRGLPSLRPKPRPRLAWSRTRETHDRPALQQGGASLLPAP